MNTKSILLLFFGLLIGVTTTWFLTNGKMKCYPHEKNKTLSKDGSFIDTIRYNDTLISILEYRNSHITRIDLKATIGNDNSEDFYGIQKLEFHDNGILSSFKLGLRDSLSQIGEVYSEVQDLKLNEEGEMDHCRIMKDFQIVFQEFNVANN